MWNLAIKAQSHRAIGRTRCIRAARCIHSKSMGANRQLLSQIWMPSGGNISPVKYETAHDMLVQACFLRQFLPGVFHLLPLGERVQSKIEKLLDKHMGALGASRMSMSTLTTEALWRKSGRFESVRSELFQLKDRKKRSMMLAPTHEEEITSLVAQYVKSYQELPLKLYQTTRKYRDEIRPRNGLLRGREFTMMDLYSFDLNYEKSFSTYEKVKEAYRAIFADLDLNVTMAEADSGDMGGNLSHEWHAALPNGSDTIFVCNGGQNSQPCGYAANDEVATTKAKAPASFDGWSEEQLIEWRGITKDRMTLVRAWLYKTREGMTAEDINIHCVKKLVSGLDTSVSGLAWQLADESTAGATHLVDIVDSRLAELYESKRLPEALYESNMGGKKLTHTVLDLSQHDDTPNIVRISDDDPCPRCDGGALTSSRSMEMGHTFYLGTRYTEPLGAKVAAPGEPSAPLHMGCYGIGVSRLLGTIAEIKFQQQGEKWTWPPAIAPFQVGIIPVAGVTQEVLDLYDALLGTSRQRLTGQPRRDEAPDVVLDDRDRTFGWKMKDAEAMGIPVKIVLGKNWIENGYVEARCQARDINQNVGIHELADWVDETLNGLESHPQ